MLLSFVFNVFTTIILISSLSITPIIDYSFQRTLRSCRAGDVSRPIRKYGEGFQNFQNLEINWLLVACTILRIGTCLWHGNPMVWKTSSHWDWPNLWITFSKWPNSLEICGLEHIRVTSVIYLWPQQGFNERTGEFFWVKIRTKSSRFLDKHWRWVGVSKRSVSGSRQTWIIVQ